jgi:uncharacterized membrane protein
MDASGTPVIAPTPGQKYQRTRSGAYVCDPNTVPERARAYRAFNGLSPRTVIPSDAVTASGSGLDPDISVANARLQAPRVARVRRLPLSTVMSLISAHTSGRTMGVFREADVGQAIQNLAPAIGSYFLSFAVISLFWLAHHRMFSWIRQLDAGLIWMNLLLLSLVALMPFPTDLLGRFGNSVAAVILYSASIAAIGLVSSAMWLWAVRERLVDPATPRPVVLQFAARALSVPVVFGLSIPIALVSPRAATYFWLLIIPFRIVLRRRLGPMSVYRT